MIAHSVAWIRRRPLVAYVGLAFAITWILIAPLALHAPISPQWHALGALGPALAALGVTWAISGRRGLAALGRRLIPKHLGPLWLSIALFSPLLLFGVAMLALRVAGQPWPNFSLLSSAEYASFAWIGSTLLAAASYGICEEIGWRGFALPRLQQGRGALAATLLLALFWALWHIPMFFYRFEFGTAQVVGFFISLVAGAIWLTFLYNSTSGSIFAVAAWHTVWNIVNIVGLLIAVDVVSLMSALVIVAAVVIVLVWRPTRLATTRKVTLSDLEPA